VLVSSHQLNEVQEIADRVVILNRGRLVQSGSIDELTAGSDTVVVRTPNAAAMHQALTGQPVQVEQPDAGTLRIRGLTTDQVGHLAFVGGVELHELSTHRFDLEDLFFALTSEDRPPEAQPPGAPS
jgi:ABC-2 type transport system ATP-binding protein